jgi:hypothetical protein
MGWWRRRQERKRARKAALVREYDRCMREFTRFCINEYERRGDGTLPHFCTGPGCIPCNVMKVWPLYD